MPYRHRGGCPGCGSPFLNLRTKDYSYLRCSKCLGIWMDWNVMAQFVSDIAPDYALELSGTHDERKLLCPECQSSMDRTHILHVPVDYCKPNNHGVWLDKDELRQVLERVNEPTDTQPEPPTSFTSLLNELFNQ